MIFSRSPFAPCPILSIFFCRKGGRLRTSPGSLFSRTLMTCAAILGVCFFAPTGLSAQPTRTDAEKDPIFKAMLQELDRSKNDLQLKGFEKPFFIQYRVEDLSTFDTRAEYGAGEG